MESTLLRLAHRIKKLGDLIQKEDFKWFCELLEIPWMKILMIQSSKQGQDPCL